MLYHEGVFYWYGEHKGGPTLLPGTCAPASPWLHLYSACLLHNGMLHTCVRQFPHANLHGRQLLCHAGGTRHPSCTGWM